MLIKIPNLIYHLKSLFDEIWGLIINNGIILVPFILMLFTITMPSYHMYTKDIVCLGALSVMCLSFDRTALFILAFSVTYTLLGYIVGASVSHFESLSYLIAPITFYCIGRLVVKTSNSTDVTATFFLLVISFSSIVLWRNNIIDGFQNGLVNIYRDVEIGGHALSATGQGLIASIGLSAISYVVAKADFKNIKTYLFLLCALISLYCVIHLVNRTGLVVLAFTILTTMVYKNRLNLKSFLLIVFLFIGIFYFLDSIGLVNNEMLDAYEERNTGDRSSAVTAGSRTEIWSQALSLLPVSPLGWYNVPNVPYAHNLWLDIARCTGWIPFILFFIIMYRCLSTLYILYRIRDDWFIGFLVGLNGCFLLSSFVEPVIESSSTYFYMIFLIWGVQQQYYYKVVL